MSETEYNDYIMRLRLDHAYLGNCFTLTGEPGYSGNAASDAFPIEIAG